MLACSVAQVYTAFPVHTCRLTCGVLEQRSSMLLLGGYHFSHTERGTTEHSCESSLPAFKTHPFFTLQLCSPVSTLQYVNSYTQPVTILAIANTRSAVEPVCLGPWLPFVTMATSPGTSCTNLNLTQNDLGKATILLYKITGLW